MKRIIWTAGLIVGLAIVAHAAPEAGDEMDAPRGRIHWEFDDGMGGGTGAWSVGNTIGVNGNLTNNTSTDFNVVATGNITNNGNIGGNVSSGGSVTNNGGIGGNVNSGGKVTNNGIIDGNVAGGRDVVNDGIIYGNTHAGGSATGSGKYGGIVISTI